MTNKPTCSQVTNDPSAIKAVSKVQDWQEEQAVNNFFKKQLSKEGKAEKLFSSMYDKAIDEEKPDWTKLILDTVSDDKKNGGDNTNNININLGTILDGFEE